jgi:hypothetical protein
MLSHGEELDERSWAGFGFTHGQVYGDPGLHSIVALA